MSTPLSTLRTMVEKKVDEAFVAVLFDKALARHTSRGLRDCGCDFCRAKKQGTLDIKYGYRWPHGTYMMLREFRKRELRRKLNDLRGASVL
jgi:hypothetical protein